MTPATDWESANSAYLAAGISWVRARLRQTPDGPVADDASWWTDPSSRDLDAAPALEILSDLFGLSRFESAVLLMCVAFELDPQLGAVLSDGQSADYRVGPTFAVALSYLPEPAWDVVSTHRPLRYWHLIEIENDPSRPLTARRLRVDERILSYVKGLNTLDERVAALVRPVRDPLGPTRPESQQVVMRSILRAWRDVPLDARLPVVELMGVDARTRRGLAAAAAGSAGLALYEIVVPLLPTVATELAEFVRLLDRESALMSLAYLLDIGERTAERDPISEAVTRIAIDAVGPIMLGSAEPWPLADRRIRLVDACRPTADEQQAAWLEQLGPEQHSTAALLADHFDFDIPTVHDCVGQATTAMLDRADGDDIETSATVSPTELWRASRDQSRDRLASLAQRIEPRATWADLVLPPAELAALHHIASQVRGRATVLRDWGMQAKSSRGHGITALFAGQSGTGKTLAAEVLAGELDLVLQRVDLSGVVSKYIGETERNLRRVFDAAEEGGVLLFFDEADALFGKRSEVKDSHDRYANIEVNYLLQRMEDFSGLAVLASNQRRALDSAFLRRLRFVITFPFPSLPERVQLWSRAFSAKTPTRDLDVDRLAELPATGGMIHNIALNSAYTAAGDGGVVTMELILEMSRNEFTKLELPLADHHFAPAGGQS